MAHIPAGTCWYLLQAILPPWATNAHHLSLPNWAGLNIKASRTTEKTTTAKFPWLLATNDVKTHTAADDNSQPNLTAFQLWYKHVVSEYRWTAALGCCNPADKVAQSVIGQKKQKLQYYQLYHARTRLNCCQRMCVCVCVKKLGWIVNPVEAVATVI